MAAEAPPPSFLNTDFNKLQMSASSLNDWFDGSDLSALLSQDMVMDFPTTDLSNQEAFYTPSPETFVASDSSAYSSDSSETQSPFDQFSTDAIQSGINSPLDDALFEQYNLVDPLLVPEIEKILASNSYKMEGAEDTTLVPEVTDPSSSKKRQRESSEVKTPVTLSRDQLLTMSSKEIEDYVSELKSKRSLTAAEEKDLKRQRRLVKNREYASQSRSRKKQFMDDLEKQLEEAKAEAEQYKKQNQTLVEENKILKKQLGSIADTIKKVQQNGALQNGGAAATKPNLSASAGNVGVFDKFVKVGAGRASNNNNRSVSACLLAIFFMVFTFAAFWDNDSKFGSKESVTFRHRMMLEEQSTDPSIWEAASSLLRESWISSNLPSWESAFSLFVSAHPSLFDTPASAPSTPSTSTPSTLSSSSDASSPIVGMPFVKQIDKIVPLKPSSYNSVPHPPPSSLPATKPCNSTE